jgi:spoIIIJ-associated protein
MEKQEQIIATIKTLLTHMGVPVTGVTVEHDERIKSHRFVITTLDSAILIGENGTRLLALNHLVKRMVSDGEEENPTSFMIDVNDYQKKRMDDIRAKAHMLAERARYFKSSVEMEPMSSYERMLVHAEFTDTPDIVTESTGYGRDRKVVIKHTESKNPSSAVFA